MAKFNIQYADKPVNVQSTAAYARPQTAELEAISRVGQSIFQIGAELQQQKDALDYSAGQRQISEKTNAALDSLTGDETADAQIRDKLQQDIGTVQYSNRRVNNALDVYRNQALPEILKSVNQRHKELLQKNTHDQFQTEGQVFLANGDLIGYQNILDRRLLTKDISKAEYDVLTKSALPDSLLEQARKLLASENPADNTRAVGILDNIQKVEQFQLTTEQLEYRNKMIKLADQQTKRNSDKAEIDIMLTMHKNKDASPAQRLMLGEQMIQKLPQSGITAERYGVMLNRIEDYQDGIDVDTDKQFYSDLRTEIISAKSTSQNLDNVRQKIYDNSDKLSTNDFQGLNQLIDSKMNRMQSRALASLAQKYKDEKSTPGYPAANLPEYEIIMQEWIENNPTAGYKDIWQKGMELMTDFDMLESTELIGQMTGEEQPVPIIATDADYDALAPGTTFLDSNGRKWRKP